MSLLRSIVYVSVAAHALTTLEFEALLKNARAFNLAHRVTGALLHSGPTFMQCIEGAPGDVDEVYDRIKNSSQHRDLVEYMDCPIDKRAFGSWDMGLANATESEMLTLSTAAWSRSGQQPFSAESPAGLELLKVFWSLRQLTR